MLEEKKFRRLILVITIIVIVSVVGIYLLYYSKQPDLKADNVKTTDVTLDMPILPFDAFSMLKEDLIIKFGEGEEGNGQDYDNQYVDYNQKWFGKMFKARYYYGLYTRIYQINLKVEKNDIQSVYDEMKKQLGTPVQDTLLNKEKSLDERKTYWVKDSVRYSIFYEDSGQCMAKMWLEYYPNPDGHNLGERPTIIQRQDGVEGIIDGEKVSILLVGDKPKYTSRYYKNLYLIIGSKSGSYLGRMPKDGDGGFYPKFTLTNIANSKNKNILIETDNEYTKWYIGFEFKNNQLNVIYSSEKEPSEQ